MNGRRAAREPQRCDSHPVVLRVSRAVGGAEHIAVLPDGRPDVLLPKLKENVRLYGLQRRRNLLHQYINRLIDVHYVASGIVLLYGRIISPQPETVDEVELESIQIPVFQRINI